ncbi:Na+/H+ antiporter NhaA [Candidatus Odyssella thessalonicensis]|uniref:Na+/H+ antiporter NhaA n=1 Tax=Candidatus Odyssella thessalonicensis TaxID=84647 RepID=UPI000225BC60|nr:Na+/H+ antiporter NhaA [Candidatus Odyssella thessalonicensis]
MSIHSKRRILSFIRLEIVSGLLLLVSLLLAIAVSNSNLYDEYQALVQLPIGIRFGDLYLDKPLIKWVNDGLMALFFLLLTLEAKFHCLEGEFKSRAAFALPFLAACGGAIIPSLIYYLINSTDSNFIKGWAIPIATDTAFVLGILAFFSNKIPLSARLFVVALSIIDDFIAVLVLAVFYTNTLHFMPLLVAFICLLILGLLHAMRISNLSLYLLFGTVLWLALVEAGIHGTIAGVLLGSFIPLYNSKYGDKNASPLKRLESYLHPLVTFVILPLFAFLNGEINFQELAVKDFFSPISLGIIGGLFVGKQLGIMVSSYIAIRLNICQLPHNMSWRIYYGTSILCGIGFTFSIFIGLLSFEKIAYINQMKLGVIGASFLSAFAGLMILRGAPNLSHNK